MARKLLISVFLIFIFQMCSNASIAENFKNFYCDYLEKRSVKTEDREILNVIQKITEDKIIDIENFLNNSNTYSDKTYAINLIEIEYDDFLENINFELNYVRSCPLGKHDARKFKRAHKKYMRRLKKCYLN